MKWAHPNMKVFLKKEIPTEWHNRNHLRMSPILVLVDEGWTMASVRTIPICLFVYLYLNMLLEKRRVDPANIMLLGQYWPITVGGNCPIPQASNGTVHFAYHMFIGPVPFLCIIPVSDTGSKTVCLYCLALDKYITYR